MPKIYYTLSDVNKTEGRFLSAVASFPDIVHMTFENIGRGTKIVVSVKGTKNNAREVRDYVASVAGVKPLKIEW